jgi:hypothetical protein
MKQTAVEYLEEMLKIILYVMDEDEFERIQEVIDEAKEMERKEIVMAFYNSKHSLCDENTDLFYLANQYYKVKFNK